jgi:spore germination cell wall hydrolase CwlJ-like protein
MPPFEPARQLGVGAFLIGLFMAVAGTDAAVIAAETPSWRSLDRETRCLALVAYAEAASEGPHGMAAVIRVVRNRVADPRFPGDPCGVALQAGQFQPVSQQPSLRRALAATGGTDLVRALGGPKRVNGKVLRQAVALAIRGAQANAHDPTAGALYFVNPDFMDPGKCAWFSSLKRTVRIGGHVFMTHHAAGETSKVAALDCRLAGKGHSTTTAAALAPEPRPRERGQLRSLYDGAIGIASGRDMRSGRLPSFVETRIDARIDTRAARAAGTVPLP